MPRSPIETLDRPLPVLRDEQVKDISTADYEDAVGFGFICVNNNSDNRVLVYETLDGTEREATFAAGSGPNVFGVPTAVKKVENAADSNTTATSILIGIL